MIFPKQLNGINFPYGDKDIETRKELIARLTKGDKPTQEDVDSVQAFLEALAETIGTRRKSILPGLGTFEWKPYRHHVPGGSVPENTYRLSFTITRSKRKYKGE